MHRNNSSPVIRIITCIKSISDGFPHSLVPMTFNIPLKLVLSQRFGILRLLYSSLLFRGSDLGCFKTCLLDVYLFSIVRVDLELDQETSTSKALSREMYDHALSLPTAPKKACESIR
jgi:hypothetical protein